MKKLLLTLICLSLSPHMVMSDEMVWDTPPTTISTVGVNSTDVEVGIDSSGNGVAVWVEGGFIKSRTILSGGSWSSISTISTTGASNPKLAVAPNGTATAIWLVGSTLKVATKPFGSAWGSASNLAASGASSPQISVDSSGNLVAVWVGSGAIKSSTKLSGGSWSILADTLAASGTDPQVVISDNGKVTAVWHAMNPISSMDAIFGVQKQINGLWAAGQTISTPSQYSVAPQVATDEDGNTIALWFVYDVTGVQYGNVTVYSSTLMNSAFSWSTPTAISGSSIVNPVNLSLKAGFSSSGAGIAVWSSSYDELSYHIESAVLYINGGWNPSTVVVDSTMPMGFDVKNTQIGEAFLIYASLNPDTSEIEIKTLESTFSGIVGQVWVNPQIILDPGSQNGSPKIAIMNLGDATNNGVLAWECFDGSNTIIKATTGIAPLLQPPSSPAVTQQSTDYGIQTEYHNVITWTPSVSPMATVYLIYRNNVIIGQVNGDETTFTDYNRTVGIVDEYGIASFNNQSGEQSSFVYISL